MLRNLLTSTVGALGRPFVWVPLAFLFAAGIGLAWGSWKNLCVECPSIAQIHTWEPQQTSKIFGHQGELIGELGIERRTPVAIDDLPPYVPQAFIAIEDRRFHDHRGFDPMGVARAAVVRGPLRPVFQFVLRRPFRESGGSTITQQLARNMFETIGFEQRVERKLKELQVAIELERAYTKEQILEAYMNQINLGPGWWGIQTASRNYFGKAATELNPAEAALLAAIANLPGHYSPFRSPDNALQRRNLVLDRMGREGFLARQEVEEWQAHPLPTERARAAEGTAPYFQEWVRQLVQARFGSQVYTGGLQIYTTLDVRMQGAAEAAMERGFERIEGRPGFNHPQYEEFIDETGQIEGLNTPYLQGLFVALDPQNGAVRAMMGGRNFNHSRFNRATQARRQPGSAFKTFVFASAIESGIPASHIVVDAPVIMDDGSGEEWRPQNFGGEFHGPMTLREAYRRSVNMIAIRLGQDEVGMETVAQTARRMGLRTEIPRVPSTAIGAPDVIPIQMAEAYSTFANMGTKVRPSPIVRVESADGEVLWEPEPERTPVMDSLSARVIVHLMEDVVSFGTAHTGVRIVGGLPREIPAAGKTGTTNNSTDVWFVGSTPTLQAAVWFGFDRPQRIHPNATGGGDAAPVWGEFMRRVYVGDEEANGGGEGAILPTPEPWSLEGLATHEVDDRTGLLASRWCPPEQRYMEVFIPGTEPTDLCDRAGPGWPRR